MLSKSEIFLQNKLFLKIFSLLQVDGEAGIQGPWQKGLPPPGSLVHVPPSQALGSGYPALGHHTLWVCG